MSPVLENAVAPTVAVGGFVFDRDGRVLLVQRGRPPGEGLWTVPGGRLEPGETLVQGVAREVREETGLIVEVGVLACVVEHISDGYHYVILDYLARPIGGTLAAAPEAEAGAFTPTAGDDVTAAKFVDEPELAALPLTNGLAPLIERARATHAAWFRVSR
jgi:ADP-ribose pyrophosphatase YjhB (NUDIX family)